MKDETQLSGLEEEVANEDNKLLIPNLDLAALFESTALDDAEADTITPTSTAP